MCARSKNARWIFYSWYEYPSINEGYKSLRVFSWENFKRGDSIEDAYGTSQYSGFEWIPQRDDYVFD